MNAARYGITSGAIIVSRAVKPKVRLRGEANVVVIR